MSQPAVLNTELALFRLHGNRRLYERLLPMFEEQALAILETLREKPAAALMAVHTLKGSAGEIGAEKLYTTLQTSELQLKQGKPVDEKMINLIADQLATLREAITDYRQP